MIFLTLGAISFFYTNAVNVSPRAALISDEVIEKSLEKAMSSTNIRSLSDLSLRSLDVKPPVFNDHHCPSSSETTRKAFHRSPQLMLYLENSFYNGIVHFRNLSSKSDLVSKLIYQVEMIANANIESAIRLGDDKIAWNGLSSSWDAFGNGTCTPSTKPELYDSGIAMLSLAHAYEVTKNIQLKEKYFTAFVQGSNYWLDTQPSMRFNASYSVPVKVEGKWVHKNSNDIKSFLSSKPASKIFKNFILGGQRTELGEPRDAAKLAAGKLLPRPFRFFYTEDDPGLVSLNCSAILGYAFLKMGTTLRKENRDLPTWTFPLSDTTIAKKDLFYIGYWTVYPVYFNLKNGNGSYFDMDTIQYFEKKYETHLATLTLPILVLAGDLLNSDEYKKVATSVIQSFGHEIDNDPRTTSGRKMSRCILKDLDSDSYEICKKEIVLTKDNTLGNYLTLSAVTSR